MTLSHTREKIPFFREKIKTEEDPRKEISQKKYDKTVTCSALNIHGDGVYMLAGIGIRSHL